MKKQLLFTGLCLLFLSCNGQTETDKSLAQQASPKSQVNPPEGSWRVNKTYDEQGNLIRFDSVYSWSSHNGAQDLPQVEQDSLLSAMRSRFFSQFSGGHRSLLHQGFPEDSVIQSPLFLDDFFEQAMGTDMTDLDKIKQQLLERHKAFLAPQSSTLIEPEDENP
ncbi:MAG: hypothetical protein ABJQ39_03445 [Winogradskyella arenosi]